MTIVQTVCDIIILVGAVILALTNILKIFGKPLGFLKKRQDKEFKERFDKNLSESLPAILNNEETKMPIIKELMPILQEIKSMNQAQNEKIEILTESSKDVLREKIMEIYYSGKDAHALTVIQRERLDQYYKDYKLENGNSYIDKYYGRMSAWDIIEE